MTWVAASLATAAPAAHAVDLASRAVTVQWTFDLNAALTEAKASKRLVLVCFNMDGEEANERALAMYRSTDFADATRDVICVLCSGDGHDGEGAVCSRFGAGTCKDHRDCERLARRHFFGALRDNVAPQHILLYPDGLVAWHAVYEVAPATLVKAIEGARRLTEVPLAQRLRSQRGFLDQAGRRAAKGVSTAYMETQARLAQTPPEHFLDALQALPADVGERILRDLLGYPRERAMPLLRAACKHFKKQMRTLATSLVAQLEAAPRVENDGKTEGGLDAARPGVQPPPEAKAATLSAPLQVLGPADDLGRVYWVGEEVSLQSVRDRITVLWFFLPDASDLEAEVAAMNEFAATQSARGIRVVGLACSQRPSATLDSLARLDCKFPVGCYPATNGAKLFGVAMFPSWVVLDPETNVVHRSPQDGKGFGWTEGRELAVRMALSPIYASRLAAPPAATAKS